MKVLSKTKTAKNYSKSINFQKTNIFLRVPILRFFIFAFYPPKYLSYGVFIAYSLFWTTVSLGCTLAIFTLSQQTIESIFESINQQWLESTVLQIIPSSRAIFDIAQSSLFNWQQLLLVYALQLILFLLSLICFFILAVRYRKDFYLADSILFQQAAQKAQEKSNKARASLGLSFLAFLFVLMGATLILGSFLKPEPHKTAENLANYIQHVGFAFSKGWALSTLPIVLAVFLN